jgi:hypothetical protein
MNQHLVASHYLLPSVLASRIHNSQVSGSEEAVAAEVVAGALVMVEVAKVVGVDATALVAATAGAFVVAAAPLPPLYKVGPGMV